MEGLEKLAIFVDPLIDAALTGPHDASQLVGSLVTDRLEQPSHGTSRQGRDLGISADLISCNRPKVKILQDGLAMSPSTSPPTRHLKRSHG